MAPILGFRGLEGLARVKLSPLYPSRGLGTLKIHFYGGVGVSGWVGGWGPLPDFPIVDPY